MAVFKKFPPSLARRLQHQTLRRGHTGSTPKSVQMSYTLYEVVDAEAAPLTVMHGLFGSKGNWNSVCKAFLKKLDPPRSVFSIDARNHGESPHNDSHTYDDLVEDMRLLFKELEVDKSSLLGHSMGGRAVMLCALKYPQLVEKVIVVDVSPVRNANYHSIPSLFEILKSVEFPSNVTSSKARTEVDKQLSDVVDNKALRAFLLTNLLQNKDGSYGWRINVSVLAEHFMEHISRFPDVGGATFEGPVLFVAGGASDYISMTGDVVTTVSVTRNQKIEFSVLHPKMFRHYSPPISLTFSKPLRNYATIKETYQSIDMAYATYESTDASAPKDTPPPVIVMHGLLGFKSNWKTVCKRMPKQTVPPRKIIAADARNHGDSPHTKEHSYEHMVEDVRALMGKLKVPRAALVGHSQGGRTVMLLALKYPEIVEKAVTVDISPFSIGVEMQQVPSLITAMKNVALPKIPKNVTMAEARKMVNTELKDSVEDNTMRSFLLMNLVKKETGSYGWRLNITALLEHFDTYLSTFPDLGGAKFEGPMLFVGGGKSDFIQKRDQPEIKKLFPNAEFVYVEGAGHWVHAEKPAEFLKICTDFLNRK